MAELLHKKWFRPTFFVLLVLLQFTLLFTATFLRPNLSDAEEAYIALVREPVAKMEPNVSYENSGMPVSVLENCISWGVPPLYPLLLRFAYTRYASIATPGIVNLVLFVATWIVLFFASRSIIRDHWKAALVPVLYGFSAGAALTVRSYSPNMLAALFASLLLLLLTALQKKPRGKLLHAALFLTVLGGFLTFYEFLILAAAVGITYACYCVVHRRHSAMVTTVITIAAAILCGVILYPASIEHITANQAGFALPYTSRLAFLYTALSDRLFGGMLTLTLLLAGLLLAASAFFRAAPKKPTQPELALSSKQEHTKGIIGTPADQREDPADAAYRRRIERRTKKLQKWRFIPLGEPTSLLFLLGSVVLITFLLLPLSHTVPLTRFPFAGERIQSAPPQELCNFLYPYLIFLFTNIFYRCIPAIGGNQKAVYLITPGFFLALFLISFVLCHVFSQPTASWLLGTS